LTADRIDQRGWPRLQPDLAAVLGDDAVLDRFGLERAAGIQLTVEGLGDSGRILGMQEDLGRMADDFVLYEAGDRLHRWRNIGEAVVQARLHDQVASVLGQQTVTGLRLPARRLGMGSFGLRSEERRVGK